MSEKLPMCSEAKNDNHFSLLVYDHKTDSMTSAEDTQEGMSDDCESRTFCNVCPRMLMERYYNGDNKVFRSCTYCEECCWAKCEGDCMKSPFTFNPEDVKHDCPGVLQSFIKN